MDIEKITQSLKGHTLKRERCQKPQHLLQAVKFSFKRTQVGRDMHYCCTDGLVVLLLSGSTKHGEKPSGI